MKNEISEKIDLIVVDLFPSIIVPDVNYYLLNCYLSINMYFSYGYMVINSGNKNIQVLMTITNEFVSFTRFGVYLYYS